MMPRLASLLFILSILFSFHWTPGEGGGIIRDGVRLAEPSDHEVFSSRKLGEIALDYEEGGPNKKHDPPIPPIPPKGKPVLGSKSP